MSIFGDGITDKENLLASFSAGSILFSDGAGGVAEDNPNLFWDDSKDQLLISNEKTYTSFSDITALIENRNNSTNAHAILGVRQSGGTSGGNAMNIYDINNLGGGKVGVSNDIAGNHIAIDTNPTVLSFTTPNVLIQPAATTFNTPVIIADNIGGTAITIGSTDNSKEGGEALWKGAGSFSDITQDIFEDKMRIFDNNATVKVLELANFGSGRFDFTLDGGIQVGAPTGGNKGVGTINVATDIYKNDSAYTNPDYVFEHYFKRKIIKFIDNSGAKNYDGLLTLKELEKYVKSNLRLPKIENKPSGIFGRADFALEKIEEIYLYLFQMKKDIELLKNSIN